MEEVLMNGLEFRDRSRIINAWRGKEKTRML
jgi:hypothetical protein